MITWNYRVFREMDGDYIIREVFYAADGTILGCSEHGVEPYGRSLEELAQAISDFQAALALPVLTLDDVPQPTTTADQQERSSTISHEQLRARLGLAATQKNSFQAPVKKAS